MPADHWMTDAEVHALLRRIVRMTDAEFRAWRRSEEGARIRVVPDELRPRPRTLAPSIAGAFMGEGLPIPVRRR
jgi:hypothetical protein